MTTKRMIDQGITDVVVYCINGWRKVTLYLSPTFIIKSSRMHKKDRRMKIENFVLTVGKPNYQEKKFIKLCKKAGEPFPIKKLQLKEYK